MYIPAFIIDDILKKERESRHATVLEELHIEREMPRDIVGAELPEEKPKRGVAEIDFFR